MLVLAQIDPATAAEGLARNPLAWFVVLLVLAVAYLFKALSNARDLHIQTIREDAKEQREVLEKIVPLASQMTSLLELVQRRLGKGE